MRPPPHVTITKPSKDSEKPYWQILWGREKIAVVLKVGSDVVDSAVRKLVYPLGFQEAGVIADELADDIDIRVEQRNKLCDRVGPEVQVLLVGEN